MANTQYQKYKNEFKKQCIFTVIGGCCAILAMILFLFVPNFKISLGKIDLINFSMYDEIKYCFDNFNLSGKSSEEDVYGFATFGGLYHIGVLVLFAIAAGMYIYETIKYALNLYNLDDYAFAQYDKIRMRQSGRSRKSYYSISASGWLTAGLFMEVIYIIFIRFFQSSVSTDEIPIDFAGGYFLFVNGISGLIVFTILFVIGAVVMKVLSKISYNKVRVAILKEDYGISNTSNPNDVKDIFN